MEQIFYDALVYFTCRIQIFLMLSIFKEISGKKNPLCSNVLPMIEIEIMIHNYVLILIKIIFKMTIKDIYLPKTII